MSFAPVGMNLYNFTTGKNLQRIPAEFLLRRRQNRIQHRQLLAIGATNIAISTSQTALNICVNHINLVRVLPQIECADSLDKVLRPAVKEGMVLRFHG